MFLARMLDTARANEGIDYRVAQEQQKRRHCGKLAGELADHYANTRCINSDREHMWAAVYCYAFDAYMRGASVFVVKHNAEPIVTAMELSNAAPVPTVKRKTRGK